MKEFSMLDLVKFWVLLPCFVLLVCTLAGGVLKIIFFSVLGGLSMVMTLGMLVVVYQYGKRAKRKEE